LPLTLIVNFWVMAGDSLESFLSRHHAALFRSVRISLKAVPWK
jgi:hypothetical protein